jgi:ribosome maturation factor RimP
MANEQALEVISGLMNELLQGNPDCFLVDIKIKPTNNIRVALDADTGISIDKCVRYNRALYKKIEEAGLYPEGDFSLEVSSPGLDEPLKTHRQYLKNIGRPVEVITLDGTTKEGKLLLVNEKEIVLEEAIGKKTGKKQGGQAAAKGQQRPEPVQHVLSFDNIKSTKIQIVF